jgi:hypothetical protein
MTVLKKDGEVKKTAMNVFHFEQCCIAELLRDDSITEKQYVL